LGVVTAPIVLLRAVVNEGDAVTRETEDCGCAESLLISAVVAQEASVVVVVNEEAEDAHVLEVLFLRLVAILNVAHVHALAKHIRDSVVHRVVEKGSHRALVRTHHCGVAIEVLAHLEHT